MTATFSLAVWLALAVAQSSGQPDFLCVKQHGRLSSQNGIALRIWLIGTNRSVGVDGPLPKVVADLEDPYWRDERFLAGASRGRTPMAEGVKRRAVRASGEDRESERQND